MRPPDHWRAPNKKPYLRTRKTTTGTQITSNYLQAITETLTETRKPLQKPLLPNRNAELRPSSPSSATVRSWHQKHIVFQCAIKHIEKRIFGAICLWSWRCLGGVLGGLELKQHLIEKRVFGRIQSGIAGSRIRIRLARGRTSWPSSRKPDLVKLYVARRGLST